MIPNLARRGNIHVRIRRNASPEVSCDKQAQNMEPSLADLDSHDNCRQGKPNQVSLVQL